MDYGGISNSMTQPEQQHQQKQRRVIFPMLHDQHYCQPWIAAAGDNALLEEEEEESARGRGGGGKPINGKAVENNSMLFPHRPTSPHKQVPSGMTISEFNNDKAAEATGMQSVKSSSSSQSLPELQRFSPSSSRHSFTSLLSESSSSSGCSSCIGSAPDVFLFPSCHDDGILSLSSSSPATPMKKQQDFRQDMNDKGEHEQEIFPVQNQSQTPLSSPTSVITNTTTATSSVSPITRNMNQFSFITNLFPWHWQKQHEEEPTFDKEVTEGVGQLDNINDCTDNHVVLDHPLVAAISSIDYNTEDSQLALSNEKDLQHDVDIDDTAPASSKKEEVLCTKKVSKNISEDNRLVFVGEPRTIDKNKKVIRSTSHPMHLYNTSQQQRNVTFNPCVKVVEYEERQSKHDKWFTCQELAKFQSDAITCIRQAKKTLAEGKDKNCFPARKNTTSSSSMIGNHNSFWKSFSASSLFSNPALSLVDDEDAAVDNYDVQEPTMKGNVMIQVRQGAEKSSSELVDTQKHSHFKHLITLAPPLVYAHNITLLQSIILTNKNNRNNDTSIRDLLQQALQYEIRNVLIVDPFDIFQTLFSRALNMLIGCNVNIVTAHGYHEAMHYITMVQRQQQQQQEQEQEKYNDIADNNNDTTTKSDITAKLYNNNSKWCTSPPLPLVPSTCGFDIILIEERLIIKKPLLGSTSINGLDNVFGQQQSLSTSKTTSAATSSGTSSIEHRQIVSSGSQLIQVIALQQQPATGSGDRDIDTREQQQEMSSSSSTHPKMKNCNRAAALHKEQQRATSIVRHVPLLVGVTSHIEMDTRRMKMAGADMIWGKPPPPMDDALRRQVLELLWKKGGRLK